MTRAIYQQWFLQFEFINAEGKPYKKCGGTFEFNPVLKTEIPTGWTVRKIKNCIKHINTGLNPRDNFVLNDGNINYITVKNLTTDGTIDFSGCDTISKQTKELIRKRSMVSKGDILFASIAPLGRCVIVAKTPDDWEINESVFSIRPNTQVVSTEYLYMFLMSDYFIKKAEHGSIGSVFNGIRISFLEDMDILIPPQTVIEEFTKRVAPLFSKRHQLVENGRILNSIKATLLPLLINGQLE